MKSRISQDPAFLWILGIGLGMVMIYAGLVGLTWHQESVGGPLVWSHGGVTGLEALFTALTALVVVYYLIETRRLRLLSQRQVEVSERARWPLITFTLELEVVTPQWQGAALFARNLGDGPAVNVTISGFATSLPINAPRSAISALSAAGQTAVVQWRRGTNQDSIRHEVSNMTLRVNCSEQTGKRQLSWVWVGQPSSPGQFTLQSFDEGS